MKKALLSMSLLSLLGLVAHADPLPVGAEAPKITAPDQDGNPVNFAEVYAKGPTLVYFYPKADTPGCTKQACSLRDDWTTLQEKGVQVLGVSVDKEESQKKFKDKYTLPFTLIADSKKEVSKAFGVNMMGALGLEITSRQSFLIKDGKVVWTMTKGTSTATHAQDVLKAYEGLK